MATIINNPVFQNIYAKKYFEQMSTNSDIYECGKDNKGNIYFAYLNGNIERYNRKEFIKKSESSYLDI